MNMVNKLFKYTTKWPKIEINDNNQTKCSNLKYPS